MCERAEGQLDCRQLQQLKQVEDSLRKLSRAVEQSADSVVITDRNGSIEYVNPAFEALSGYSREEVIGKNPRLLKSGEQSPDLYRTLWETILSGNVFRGVLANRKKNGELFYLEKTITPVRDSEGTITHFISNDRDITERRRLEQQLFQVQKMDAIGRLAGGVAHDFNNLLMIVSSYAELTLEELPEADPLRHKVAEILHAARRAADLTRQLLGFGRKQMQALRLLDLNSVLNEISRMLPRLIGEDIELEIITGRKLQNVHADPVQIEQVLMNLAANARDAMPRGGKLTIETGSVVLDRNYTRDHGIVPPGEYVLLAVTDSGDGIAPEHLPHIFEPFYTTKEEGKGTGLGLATVYGIVKQNAGFIWVYSELGIGTTFKIYLPAAHKEQTRTQIVRDNDATSGGSETVLLVEDDPFVRQPVCEFLRHKGYTLLEAENGIQALSVARGYPGPIHLMVSDVIMPQMSGAQLADRLLTERPHLRVLFVSGYAENTVLRHGNIDVTHCFLQKPFGLNVLARKVREILDAEVAAAAAAGGSH